MFWFRDLPWYISGLYWGCFLSIVIFKSLTNDVNLSIQSLFLSNISMASNVTPFFWWFCGEWLSLLLVAFINGVEDCPVNCLSNFSLVSTLFAKSMASLRLFTLIKSSKVYMEGCSSNSLIFASLHNLVLLWPDSLSKHRSLLSLCFHQIWMSSRHETVVWEYYLFLNIATWIYFVRWASHCLTELVIYTTAWLHLLKSCENALPSLLLGNYALPSNL